MSGKAYEVTVQISAPITPTLDPGLGGGGPVVGPVKNIGAVKTGVLAR